MTIVFRNRRLVLCWACLIALTLASFKSGPMSRAADAELFQPIFVILLAGFKMRMIAMEFMQLRTAPVLLRFMIEIWILLLCVAILLMLFRA